MISYDIVCKQGYSYDVGFSLVNAFDSIKLEKPYEVGEIINDYWLICNSYFGSKYVYKYNSGEYVKIMDIRYFDAFATDMNYDNREDLEKVSIKTVHCDKKKY